MSPPISPMAAIKCLQALAVRRRGKLVRLEEGRQNTLMCDMFHFVLMLQICGTAQGSQIFCHPLRGFTEIYPYMFCYICSLFTGSKSHLPCAALWICFFTSKFCIINNIAIYSFTSLVYLHLLEPLLLNVGLFYSSHSQFCLNWFICTFFVLKLPCPFSSVFVVCHVRICCHLVDVLVNAASEINYSWVYW